MTRPPLVMKRGLALSAILLIANASEATLPSLRADFRLTQKAKKSQKDKKKSKSNAPEEAGRPVLWEDRGDLSRLNLFLGVGSEGGQPKPPYLFKVEPG